MKKLMMYVITFCFLAFFGCSTSQKWSEGKTYYNFRGFEPIDPIEYM